jgi:YbbR domain-containing protein
VSWLRSTGLRLLLAIGLAFALWIFVSYTENPDRSIQFKDRPVIPEGLAPGLVIVDQNGLPDPALTTVTITLEADRETLAAPGISDVQAYVSLNDLGPADHIVPVGARVTLPGRQPDITAIVPSHLPIRIDQVISQTVPLTIEVDGTVPFSYEPRTPSMISQGESISETLVTGPRNQVEQVVLTRVTANIDRLTGNYDSPRQVEALGADGKVVAGVTVVPQSVRALVPIVSSVGIKRVPVVPRVVGEPASGYVVAGVAITPQFVRLTGSAGPLEQVQSVETQPVDVTGASGTISRTVRLQQLNGTSLLAGEPISATVQVQIAPISRSFQVTLPIPITVSDVGAGLLFSVNPQVVPVALTGSAERLAALDAAKLQGIVSARDLSAGTYMIAPQYDLPLGIKLVNESKVTLILRQIPTPTEAPTTTPSPQGTPELPPPTEAPTAVPTEASPNEPTSPTATGS